MYLKSVSNINTRDNFKPMHPYSFELLLVVAIFGKKVQSLSGPSIPESFNFTLSQSSKRGLYSVKTL